MTGSVLKGAVGEGFVDPAVSFCFVSTVEGGVSTTLVETSGNVTGTTIGDASCFSDAVETSIAIVTGSFDVVIGILVSSDVIAEESETSVGSVPVSCDFAETSVGVGVSLSVDGSSGMTLSSSSRGPLVLSITTDVSALSIISAAKTCMRFQPVTFSISKAIVSWYILFKDKTRLNLKEQIIVQVRH